MTGRYFQDWLLHETDWNWRLEPDKGGALRAVGDIGSHWLDLMTFITGQPVVSVMADLATFIGQRQQPTGPVETFSTERVERDRHAGHGHRGRRHRSCSASPTVLAARVGHLAGQPGRKNSLQYEIDGSDAAAAWDSETPDHLWIGHRDRPNEILQRNPALMNEAGRAAAALPGGHVEGFGDTFGALFRAIYADVASRAHGRSPDRTPPLPTATTRCSSATPSRPAPRRVAGSTWSGRRRRPVRAPPALSLRS